MKPLELEVRARQVLGKKVRFLRRQGITPAHIYGRSISSLSVQVDSGTFQRVLAQGGRTRLIALKLDGADSPRMSLVREVQREPITGRILHVDFYQVEMTEKIKTEVPIVLVGEAPAAKAGRGMVLPRLDSLHIECLPGSLPTRIEVDLSPLVEIDQAIFVRDLSLPPEVTLLTDPEQEIARVVRTGVEEEVAEKPMVAEEKPEAEAVKEATSEQSG